MSTPAPTEAQPGSLAAGNAAGFADPHQTLDSPEPKAPTALSWAITLHQVGGSLNGFEEFKQSRPLLFSQKPLIVGGVVSRKVALDVTASPTLPATSVAYAVQR
jgi:hypothetical protein